MRPLEAIASLTWVSLRGLDVHLSLDVEGFEHEVLLGLDLRRHRPSLILAESSTTERARQIEEHLSPTYALIDRPTEIDFLYRAVGADLR